MSCDCKLTFNLCNGIRRIDRFIRMCISLSSERIYAHSRSHHHLSGSKKQRSHLAAILLIQYSNYPKSLNHTDTLYVFSLFKHHTQHQSKKNHTARAHADLWLFAYLFIYCSDANANRPRNNNAYTHIFWPLFFGASVTTMSETPKIQKTRNGYLCICLLQSTIVDLIFEASAYLICAIYGMINPKDMCVKVNREMYIY